MCIYTKATKLFARGVFTLGENMIVNIRNPSSRVRVAHLNIGYGESITLCPSQILDIVIDATTTIAIERELPCSFPNYHTYAIQFCTRIEYSNGKIFICCTNYIFKYSWISSLFTFTTKPTWLVALMYILYFV